MIDRTEWKRDEQIPFSLLSKSTVRVRNAFSPFEYFTRATRGTARASHLPTRYYFHQFSIGHAPFVHCLLVYNTYSIFRIHVSNAYALVTIRKRRSKAKNVQRKNYARFGIIPRRFSSEWGNTGRKMGRAGRQESRD